MALSYSNITIELREILLKARPKSLIEISPKGTVPVLQLLNGFVIDESIDIMKWAIQHSNSLKLLNDNPKLQKLLINQNDSEFKIWLDRYKYNDRNKNYSLDELVSHIQSGSYKIQPIDCTIISETYKKGIILIKQPYSSLLKHEVHVKIDEFAYGKTKEETPCILLYQYNHTIIHIKKNNESIVPLGLLLKQKELMKYVTAS